VSYYQFLAGLILYSIVLIGSDLFTVAGMPRQSITLRMVILLSLRTSSMLP
jgi:hypothetical protein